MGQDNATASVRAEGRPLSREELIAALQRALWSSSGITTRNTECWMAGVAAEHIADKLAGMGIVCAKTAYP